MTTAKVCTGCRLSKPLEEYGFAHSRRNAQCKQCCAERSARYRQLVRALVDSDKPAPSMNDRELLSHRRIAKIMGVTHTTVENVERIALGKLRKAIKRERLQLR